MESGQIDQRYELMSGWTTLKRIWSGDNCVWSYTIILHQYSAAEFKDKVDGGQRRSGEPSISMPPLKNYICRCHLDLDIWPQNHFICVPDCS